MRVLEAASIAGAERLILCDTNGGSLPQDVSNAVASVAGHLDTGIGVHLHNDTGCGVANALAGVMAGAHTSPRNYKWIRRTNRKL
ncbi:MAG: hypothetical protein CM15mP49_14070 [Actinomycetota bacterium]|nr:MAG: hypothetical protein CM15mP49_14070 [Actinomycetota bacterium]